MPYTLFRDDFCLTDFCYISMAESLSCISHGTVLQNYDISPERQHTYSLVFIKHVECISSIQMWALVSMGLLNLLKNLIRLT